MSERAAAAIRVNAALDILEKVSSTGGQGALFSYRGTELTYQDLRVLARSDVQWGNPVAWIEHHKGGDNLVWDATVLRCTPLYKRPDEVHGE